MLRGRSRRGCRLRRPSAFPDESADENNENGANDSGGPSVHGWGPRSTTGRGGGESRCLGFGFGCPAQRQRAWRQKGRGYAGRSSKW
jgi:hypothetical protein